MPTTRNAILGFVAVQVLVVTIACYITYTLAIHESDDTRVANCERGKKNQIDNARSAYRQAIYLEGVASATSVKQDVKGPAAINQRAQAYSAADQMSRLILCEPYVREDKSLPDEEALRLVTALPPDAPEVAVQP